MISIAEKSGIKKRSRNYGSVFHFGFPFLSKSGFRPAAAGAEADEVTHDKLRGFYRFDPYRYLELVAINRSIVVEDLVAADPVIIYASVVLGLLEVRVQRVNQALARIRRVRLVYEIPGNLICHAF